MKTTIKKNITEHAYLIQKIAENPAFEDKLFVATQAMINSLKRGGKILLFGNGGSAGDAEHFATELVGNFCKREVALPAIALTENGSVLTALANDGGYEDVFVRQIKALANANDLCVGFTTSGKSENVLRALKAATEMDVDTIVLCGENTESIVADIVISVPSCNTARIQEMHGLIVHCLAESVKNFFETGEING